MTTIFVKTSKEICQPKVNFPFFGLQMDIFTKVILQKKEIKGVKSKEKIVFQNENSFVSFQEYQQGISTTSLFESLDKIVTIRTFIEKGYTFSQKSECFKQ